MTNKTLERQIVRPAEGFATLAHHALVIVNEANGGKQHRQTVLPGGKAKLPLLGRAELGAYHVPLDDYLRSDFTCKQLHSDQVHAFTLVFNLSFRVLSERPEVVVLRCEQDPLGKVEEEVKRVLCPRICAMPWAALEEGSDLDRFVESEHTVDDSGERVLSSARLRSFADTWGIDLRQIKVTRHLDEVDVKHFRVTVEAQRESKIRTTKIESLRDESREDAAKIEIERDLNIRRAHSDAQVNLAKLPGAWAMGTHDAIREISSKPGSFYEINQQFQQAMLLADSVRQMSSSYGRAGNGAAELEAGTGELPRLLASKTAGAAAQADLRSTLNYACDVSLALPGDEKAKKLFLAAILRLVGAVLADEDDVKDARQRLSELHARYAQEMPDEHSNFVLNLGNKP